MCDVLKVSHIEKTYGGRNRTFKVINDISFSVKKGEFAGIMGASGSGKTTLLNCISTIDSVTSGDICIEGKNVTALSQKEITKFRRESLGFIFQEFNLLDTLSVFENIALPLAVRKIDSAEIKSKVDEISDVLKISDILSKFPNEISGGQKQRAACARAVIGLPKLLLADEPTGSLDSASSKVLMDSFKTINQRLDATILMVTHDPFVASYCDRILFIKDGKIFNEISKGQSDRKHFFDVIINNMSALGGEVNAF